MEDYHLPVKDAEAVVAIAMKAGATELSDVKRHRAERDVVDRTRLQNRGARARERIRKGTLAVPDSMASGLGTKLSALLYASNCTPIRPSRLAILVLAA